MQQSSTPPTDGAARLDTITVLMVEDDPDDVYLTRQALADSKLRITLEVVNDGVAALQYLRAARNGDGGHRRPDLILLDLNLPKKDGREVLGEIKADLELKHIPVVVLTTSDLDEDLVQSYKLQANCYISKPVDLEQFITVVRSIEDFWLTIVTLPRGT